MRILRYNFRILNHQRPECTLLDAANFSRRRGQAHSCTFGFRRLPQRVASSAFNHIAMRGFGPKLVSHGLNESQTIDRDRFRPGSSHRENRRVRETF